MKANPLATAIAISISVVGISAASSPRGEDVHPWTSTVDWFRPPPKSLWNRKRIEIPHQLITVVPQSLENEAFALLRDVRFVQLSSKQAEHFRPGPGGHGILQSVIMEKATNLRFFQNDSGIGLYGKEREEWKAHRRGHIKDLQVEIDRLRAWNHHLNPYLVRTVALHRSSPNYIGSMTANVLVISQLAVGDTPVPIKKTAVVVYLPVRPREVYASILGIMRDKLRR